MPTRRMVLKDLGKAGIAVVLLGPACASRETAPSTTTATSTSPSTTALATSTTFATPTTQSATTASAVSADRAPWTRIGMTNVAAYLRLRDGEVLLVDTGEAGAEGEIETALTALGLGWSALSNVILTHRHPDHIGSIDAVSAAAPAATIHIGGGDADTIGPLAGPTSIASDGASVFGLTVIATPGHTPGHVSVLDGPAGVLVAGDALNNRGQVLASASADSRFTDDGGLADESVRRLAGFDFEVAYFGHGTALTSDASTLVGHLAASL